MRAPLVKICGLTRKADVDAAVAQGAWALGFVMWPGSPRAVSASQVRALTLGVSPSVRRTAVVVDPTVDEARKLRDEAGLTTLQLHGSEDPASFLDLGMEVFKAVSLQNDADVGLAAALPSDVVVLVDAHDPSRRGGTGQRADWTRAAALAMRRPILLAGGLDAENVRDAIAQVSPWGVDVSSGVETLPGIKDAAKLEAFFAAARPRPSGPGRAT